jgi:hypothetical protein
MKINLNEFFTLKLCRFGKIVLALAFMIFASQNFFAQGTRGTIKGTVVDQSGAVVPNASVRLFDATKGTEIRSTQSNESGVYQFLEIEPSTYNLTITAAGFSDARIVDVKVEPNRNIELESTNLTVSGATNEVTVSAGVELIDKESSALGTTVDRRRVEGLPLNGRNVLDLALLQPGVAPAEGGFGNGSGIRVNGSRGVENNITLDGGNNNEVAVGGTIGGQPRPDAVQEFRLLTSSFEAEFGRNTGSVINVVTKSGTNDYHGNARFFYRGTELSAARFLDKAVPNNRPAGSDFRRKFDRKEYGFNIGGPIPFLNFGEGGPVTTRGRDRTFFFADYERRYQVLGQSATLPALPTTNERNGVFSVNITDPATGQPFPNNTIPTSRFSPIARYYLNFLPQTSGGQAQVSANQITKNNFFTTRIDHNINQNHSLNFTYNFFDSDVFSPFAFGGASVPGFGASDLRETNNYVGRYTYVINSNLVNALLLSYSTNEQPGVAPVNTDTPASIGFTGNFVANAAFAGPPQIRLADRGITLGNSIQGPQRRFTENLQIQDSLSYVVGSHRLKFGVDATKYKQDTDFLFINQGLFQYSAVGLQGTTNTTGDDFADFLIGNTPATAQYGAAGARDYRQRAAAIFAQDSWRATGNLTLSYGIRYEYNSPLKDKFNRVAYYRPGATSLLLTSGQLRTLEGQRIVLGGTRAPRGLVFVGDPDPVLGGTVPVGGIEPDKNNFAPRVGFAYSLGGDNGLFNKGLFKAILGENQTVIRAGFGLYYGAVIGDTALQQLSAPGFNGTNAFFFPNGGTLADPFAVDPYPAYGGLQPQISSPFAASQFAIQTILTQFSQPIDPFLKTPQVSQFNVTLERGFAKDYVVGFSYVGSRGRKLYSREQINPALGTLLRSSLRPETTPLPSTANSNNRRLNDDIRLGLTLLTAGGNSQYDSFQANFQKRYSDDGLLFQLAYTFSKSINDSDSQRGQLDLLNRNAGRGLSDDDVPHRVVGSFLYELPFFKNTNGFLKRIVDGFSIGAIYNYQSGRVLSVGNPIDIDGTGGALINFADLGTEAYTQIAAKKNDRQAFNVNAFRIADCRVLLNGAPVLNRNFDLCVNADGTKGRRGTSARNQFRLNNIVNNWDAIITKRTKLFSERNNLELRFEAFNLFNTTQFTTVNTNLNNVFRNPDGTVNFQDPRTTFGKYTNQRESRSIQLAARINF